MYCARELMRVEPNGGRMALRVSYQSGWIAPVVPVENGPPDQGLSTNN